MSEPEAPSLLRASLKALALVAFVAAGYLGSRALGFTELDSHRARAWAESHGTLAPVLATLLYAVLVSVAAPGAPLTLVCGFAFGWLEGGLVALAGANLGANAAFFVARFLGRDLVVRLVGKHLARLEAELARDGGAEVVVTLRLVPFVPFTAINFGAGVVPGLRWRDYALGTGVGMVPAAFAYTALGESPDPEHARFWIAVAALQVLAALPIAFRWVMRRKRPRPV